MRIRRCEGYRAFPVPSGNPPVPPLPVMGVASLPPADMGNMCPPPRVMGGVMNVGTDASHNLRRSFASHNLRRSFATRNLRRVASPPPPPFDPLKQLGTDIFHEVLRYMTVSELLVVEQVSPSWKNFSRTNGALWRWLSLREEIDSDEVDAMDVILRQKPRERGGRDKLTPWRRFCLNTIPMQRAWVDGRAQFRGVKYLASVSVSDPPPVANPLILTPRVPFKANTVGQVAFVTPGLFVTSGNDNLTLSTLTSVIDTVVDVPTYHHLEACAGFVIGMHTSNRLHSVSPKPLPTRVDVFRVVPAHDKRRKGGRPWLELVCVLEHPPIWGYALRTHYDYSTTDPRLVVAVLAGETKSSGNRPDDHWTSVRQRRSVHLWTLDLDANLKSHQKIVLEDVGFAKSLELDEKYVFIPSPTHLHIYTRKTGERLVSLPSPPLDAAVAFRMEPHLDIQHPSSTTAVDPQAHLPIKHIRYKGRRRAQPMFWNSMQFAHARPPSRRKDQYTKCRTTKKDLFVTSSSGALFILRKYRRLLKRMETLDPRERVDAATEYTMVIATGQPIYDMATHGDKVALRMAHYQETLVTFDAAINLPPLPLSFINVPEPPPPEFAHVPEFLPFVARVIASHKGRERPIEHGMYMDATGVYYPAGKTLRAHFFGSLPVLEPRRL